MTKRNRWPSFSPRAILIITLVLAAAVFIGGLYLARRDEQLRIPGDRKKLQAVGEELEKKSGQLERLYEKDLRHLISITMNLTDDPTRIAQRCDSIVGIVQWSLIHGANGTNGIHVPVDPTATERWPHPTFQNKPDDPQNEALPLSKKDLLQAEGQTWGWITDPGKPFLFWQRTDTNSDTVVVLLIDPQAVHTALDNWFAQWVRGDPSAVSLCYGSIYALKSSDSILFFLGELPTRAPDFVFPIRSLFGSWEIVSWDRIILITHYDVRTLFIAGFLALLIVLLGIVAYLQQKQLLTQTAQRVTFVNRVSHELRSPLTNILLNLELTRDMLPDSAEQPALRLVLVQEEAHRLRRLVDNVLAFSSLEQGKYRLEPKSCVPDQIIQAVIRQFAPSFARRGLIVNYQSDVITPCLLEPDALTQILSNLFSNIEKYVPRGNVTIEARFQSGSLVITVTDEGPGIPAREAERIFQPFERLDGRINEGSTGTGLGLSIARELAAGMGGALRLIPSKLGASFELRLPVLTEPTS